MMENDDLNKISLDEEFAPTLKRFRTNTDSGNFETNEHKHNVNDNTNNLQEGVPIDQRKQTVNENKEQNNVMVTEKDDTSKPKNKGKKNRTKTNNESNIENKSETGLSIPIRRKNSIPVYKKKDKKAEDVLINSILSQKTANRRSSYKNNPNAKSNETNKVENTKENDKISSTPPATIADEYIESEESNVSDEYVEEEESNKIDKKEVTTMNTNDINIELHIKSNTSVTDDGIDFCYKNRKPKQWWSQEETEALLEGVKKFGRGKWIEIYKDNLDIFRNRRKPRDLSDKMRILDKSASIYVYPNTVYTEVDESGEPVLYGNGVPKTYLYKFPHEAAVMIASASPGSHNKTIRVICEDDGGKAIHIYKAFNSWQGRYRVRKLSGKSKKRVDGY